MTITVLTADQRAAIPEHVQRWICVGLSTEPVNRKRATKAVLDCYKLAGLLEPRVEFVPSFRTDAGIEIRGAVLYAVKDAVLDAVLGAVLDVVLDAVWDEVRGEVWNEVRGEVGLAIAGEVEYAAWTAACSGQYDADTCAFWRFFTDVLGIEVSADIRARLDAWCEVVQSCGGVYWGRDVVTIVDQPQAFERDRSGSITAVVYRDEWRVRV